MVDRTFCPVCHDLRDRRIIHRLETLPVRGEMIEVDAEVALCATCGEEVTTMAMGDAILERAYGVYRLRHGILAPEQIRVLRESTGLSQRGFARLLGWGEVQVSRYETGAVPDDAHNSLLVALQDPEAMYRFVQQRHDRLQPLDQRKVQAAMNGRLAELGVTAMRRGIERRMEAYALADRGYRPFDLERVGHTVLYLVSGVRTGMVKLNKMLWYVDFLSYKRSSLALVGLPYRRLPMGPIPDLYKALFAEIEDEGYVRGDVVEYPSGVEGTEYKPAARRDTSFFTDDEIDVLNIVKDRLGPLTGSQAADLSHKERAWIETPPNDVVSYKFAKDLSLN